jgi:hypothetical protein
MQPSGQLIADWLLPLMNQVALDGAVIVRFITNLDNTVSEFGR